MLMMIVLVIDMMSAMAAAVAVTEGNAEMLTSARMPAADRSRGYQRL